MHGRSDGGPSGNPSATDDAVTFIEDGGLSWSNGTQGLERPDDRSVILPSSYFGQVS